MHDWRKAVPARIAGRAEKQYGGDVQRHAAEEQMSSCKRELRTADPGPRYAVLGGA